MKVFIGDNPAERRLPYDNISGAEQYLLTLKGGDHMVFSGIRVNKDKGKKDPIFHDLICQGDNGFLGGNFTK